MPVTAKLSRRFYERLGDEIANDLVDWFNAVDATYRSDLREHNELTFARFTATMDHRFAESDARWERRLGDLESRLMKWMFVYWTGTMLGMAGLFLAIFSR